MKHCRWMGIGLFLIVAILAACQSYPRELERMAVALEQAKSVYGNGENDTLLFIPDLAEASVYYAERKQYDKAALAALYNGYAEKDYDKTVAMESFKTAEQYGKLVQDSLTIGRSQFQMGKMLYDDYLHKEALSLLQSADCYLGQHYQERSCVQNTMACCFLLLKEYDNAAICLDKSLEYAEIGHSSEARKKALNNYAVMYRLTGQYSKAIECLRLVEPENQERQLLNYLNLGNVFSVSGAIDSASYYYGIVEKMLTYVKVEDETKAAAYTAFSQFSQKMGDCQTAMNYESQKERYIEKVHDRIESNNIYRIQQKYDNERLRREAKEQLMRKRNVIFILVIVLVALFGYLVVTYYRYVQKRLREVELNGVLLQFMNENSELLRIDAIKEQKQQELIQKLNEIQQERIKTMQKFDIFLKDRKNVTALTELEKHLFSRKDHWKVMLEMIEEVYPGLYSKIKEEYPTMDELECKVCILSRFKLSRPDEAAILGVSISVLDKVRGRVRKLMES